MEFDSTTFVLEVINFLILVWILKRFLYRPVLDIIARRRAGIEKMLADAQQIEAEANNIKLQNERHLAEWEAEKEAAQAQLMSELAAMRESKVAALDAAIMEEAERRRVLEERRRREFEQMIEERGIAQGAEFSSKLLSRLASPELEAKLYALLLEDLNQLPLSEKDAVTKAATNQGLQIKVHSAFLLDKDKQEVLSNSLTEMLDRTLPIEYCVNPELIAGFQIDIGPWILQANLRDELKFFSKALRHAE